MGNVTLVWRRSRACDSGHCVEVATTPAAVHVRDSKNPQGGSLAFAPETWQAFVDTLRTGPVH